VETGEWQDVAAVADIPEEGGLAIEVGERKVALFRDGDKVVAIEDSCPHRGGRLSEGIVRNGTVFCPLHAWCFRLSDGCNEDEGPDADVFPVQVEGDRVKVKPVPPSA
jgi:nitrite reductase (NADH) small subunit